MLIFPSHLQHHVEVNNSEEDRISISFNIRFSKSTDPWDEKLC